jgi:outer membrane translocation and assembly module TamA
VVSFGETPFMYLPQLGGLFVGRGYPYGRYRDRNLAALQGEARWKMTPRWGLTLFAEAGEVAVEAADFSLEKIKPGMGAGIRFAVSPPSETHIRFDVGLTPDSFGIYITLMEAF